MVSMGTRECLVLNSSKCTYNYLILDTKLSGELCLPLP